MPMSSNTNLAIEVKDIVKNFQVYEQPENRLKQSIYPKIQKLFGLQAGKYFNEFTALNGVNLTVHKGETIGIVGRNGSGKSTLLQIICGTLNPSAGSVTTHGRIAALLELGSGFNPEFSGKENVYLNGSLLGLSKFEIDQKYDDILAFADIGDFIDQPIKTYSSGMAIRLAFSVAINVDPDILVVDEALSVGDELFQRKCFSKIEDIKKKGATILFVSHSGGTIIELCDRAILIDAGIKLLEGKPKNVIAKYQKLLYAPANERTAIRDEMISENTTSQEDNIQVESHSIHVEATEEVYDPNLRPISTVEYVKAGAEISDAHIFLSGVGRVNHLVSGKKYQYAYNVKFTSSIDSVRFGMLVKTISGVELGGSVSAYSQSSAISFVPSGAEYKVVFDFTCALNPGTYFLNAGVLGIVDGNETYLHRLIDAAMFKVIPQLSNATGIVNFNTTSLITLTN